MILHDIEEEKRSMNSTMHLTEEEEDSYIIKQPYINLMNQVEMERSKFERML